MAHPGGPVATNKAAALAKFLERKLKDPNGLASINPDLLELAVNNAKQTVYTSNNFISLCFFFLFVCVFFIIYSFFICHFISLLIDVEIGLRLVTAIIYMKWSMFLFLDFSWNYGFGLACDNLMHICILDSWPCLIKMHCDCL